jgi:amino acid adenylation domain-containing protein/thioester reductase-like protein
MIRTLENLCVHDLLNQQVEKSPEAIAVSFGDQHLTYRQLDDRANQLAHYLQTLGVQPETMVGVCVERSLEMLIAMVAIFKAGGAYIPIDPSYPGDRIAFMLEDSQLTVLVTQTSLLSKIPSGHPRIVDLTQDTAIIAAQSTQVPESAVAPHNLAYTIYTSGSTGQPKGVQIIHSAVVNFLRSMQVAPGISAQDVLLAITTISFDIAVLELFLPLTVGAQIVLAPRETVTDALALCRLFEQSQPTIMQATPATWRMLLAVNWSGDPGLKILCGGEAITHSLATQLSQYCGSLWNMYGPTETTIWSTIHQIQPGENQIAIGRPIANTQIYLLDGLSRRKDDQSIEVPIGEPGEVYIGGDGLARGYWNRPELTAESFIPNPFSQNAGDRLYRTGDLARYLPNGSIQYIGRVDHQVKIRGHRIELGDIEAALSQSPFVRDAAVIVHEDATGEKNLVAYITPQSAAAEMLQTHASEDAQQDVTQQWQQIWDSTYSQGQEPVATFNFTGWNSSYTGQQAPSAELSEWLEQTIDRITCLQPQKILEIGCGMGLLLFQLAPDSARYVGTDISLTAIQQLRQTIAQEMSDCTEIELFQQSADTIHELPIGQFDTIVINSVIQYFPDVDYLMQVLKSALQLLEPGGRIFVGDVRSLPLLEAFHTSVQLYQAPKTLPVTKLKQRIQQHMAQERELVLDPAFFAALKTAIPEIAQVQIQLKGGCYQNEFTQFRYDVVLYREPVEVSAIVPTYFDWQKNPLSVSDIQHLLLEEAPELLGIRNIANARLLRELQIMQWLTQPVGDQTVADLRQALTMTSPPPSLDPEAIWAIAVDLSYDIVINWADSSKSGHFDAWFSRRSTNPPVGLCQVPQQFNTAIIAASSRSLHDYANNPLQTNIGLNLIAQVRSFLKEKLPDYMVPHLFVEMEALPLTPNGKIDRRSLPAPSQTRPNLREAYVAPRNALEEQLVGLWEELLKVAPIGIHDNFFELGGHSLLVAQLMMRLKQKFQVEISLTHLFQAPMIAAYAKVIKSHQHCDIKSNADPDAILNLELEATLDPQIYAETSYHASQTPNQHILLTGATGFLGAFLLDELLRKTQATIYCLTRGANVTQAKQKLLNNLQRFALNDQGVEGRIVSVLGDLAQPLLGLTPDQFETLATTIDVIYHNGAFVNLIYPYTAMRDANVLGTQSILQLASQRRIKPVHFVSTLDIFQSTAYADAVTLSENDELLHWQGLKNGYAQSKWVAERLVIAAHNRGIPTCIYRVGMITGHSQTGVSKSDDLAGRMLKGFIQMGSAPAIDLALNFTPVDYVSQTIVHLSHQSQLWGKAFHVFTPHVLPLSQLVQALNTAGYRVEKLPYAQWLEILCSPAIAVNNALSPFKVLFTEDDTNPSAIYLEALSLQRVSADNTVAGLVDSLICCAAVDADCLNRYLVYLRSIGFLHDPMAKPDDDKEFLVLNDRFVEAGIPF